MKPAIDTFEPLGAARIVPVTGGRAWCFEPIDGLDHLLAASRSPAAAVLKRDDRSEVVRVEHGGRAWVVKRYRLPRVKQIIQQVFGQSPAWREVRGAAMLARHGIAVGVPVALARLSRGRGEALVLQWVSGITLGEALGRDLPHEWRWKLAAALGRQAGRITAGGLVNRDHKPANIIVNPDADPLHSGGEPVMIDPLGIRRRKRGSDEAIWRMLELLGRCLRETGRVAPREVVTFIRAMLEADPSLAVGQRHARRHITRQIGRISRNF